MQSIYHLQTAVGVLTSVRLTDRIQELYICGPRSEADVLIYQSKILIYQSVGSFSGKNVKGDSSRYFVMKESCAMCVLALKCGLKHQFSYRLKLDH